ncbi:MAG: glycosyltransferase family 4 protein [Candidatus Cloacimonetes bacterium]|jgi:glycosyltransferase involved in cell wall biosynthesis|nr:glycosyltransferase family 4 protein [Candidatus Cloacimonadota bacterium]
MSNVKKIKILHLISQRPNSTGSGMYVQAMIREAAACRYDNFLVAGVNADVSDEIDFLEPDKIMFVKFNDADVSHHIPGMSDVMPYESVRFCDLSAEELNDYETAFSKILQRAVDKFKPDIIHSHHLWIVSSLARQLFPEIPMVTTCHGTDLRQFKNCPSLRKRVLKGCKEIDVVMALSEDQKKEIIRLYKFAPEKIIVVGAGFNDDLFYPEIKPKPDPAHLVYAGKLSNAKGVPWLLRALREISFPDWQLQLVGSGTGKEKENCLLLAKEFGDKVCLHGAVPQEKLAEIMRRAHIFILPSFYEGLALVILEALASGCRIVATDLPGIKEILGNYKTDFISLVKLPRLRNTDQPYQEDENEFEQDLKDAIQQQIKAAIVCPQTNLSSIQNKIDSFTWSSVFEKVSEVYLKCLD